MFGIFWGGEYCACGYIRLLCCHILNFMSSAHVLLDKIFENLNEDDDDDNEYSSDDNGNSVYGIIGLKNDVKSGINDIPSNGVDLTSRSFALNNDNLAITPRSSISNVYTYNTMNSNLNNKQNNNFNSVNLTKRLSNIESS